MSCLPVDIGRDYHRNAMSFDFALRAAEDANDRVHLLYVGLDLHTNKEAYQLEALWTTNKQRIRATLNYLVCCHLLNPMELLCKIKYPSYTLNQIMDGTYVPPHLTVLYPRPLTPDITGAYNNFSKLFPTTVRQRKVICD